MKGEVKLLKSKKSRLFLGALMVLLILLNGFILPLEAQGAAREAKIFIDGLLLATDVAPVIENGRVLVPFRVIGEALNVNVDWDNLAKTVNASQEGITVSLKIGSKTAYLNQNPVLLDVSPQIIEGRTLIPLRFFGEAFNCQVGWDNNLKEARIFSPPQEMSVIAFYALGDSKTSSWTNLFGLPYPQKSAGHTALVSDLSLGWYSLDAEGNLLTRSTTGWQRPQGWEDVLKAAEDYNLKREMVVHLTDGDGTLSALLKDEALTKKAAEAIAEEAKIYQGINLDFEGLGFKDEGAALKEVQNNFTRFVQLLSDEIKASDLTLTLTLHAPNSAYKGYDYKALGQIADRIIIMAYDYGAKPEPVNLVIQAVEIAKSLVPPEKLILGISIPSETPESLVTKIGIAKRYNLGGIALWRLGLLNDEMWQTLKMNVIPAK
jgi:hypothetical protein